VLGAIVGDVVGSVYEWAPLKAKDFPLLEGASRFTDDTVLTVAIADAMLSGADYAETVCAYALRYPHAGYGGLFLKWAHGGGGRAYHSWGNGSAMRVSPVGWALEDVEAVLSEAERTAAITHSHPEGIKGAQATALAVFLARHGATRDEIRREVEERFAYVLDRSLDEIRPSYTFDVSCKGSVPESLICFLESTDYEDAIRNAVSLGGDADTKASIAGAVAEAFYGGVPNALGRAVLELLPSDLRDVVARFRGRFE